jgi:hypothetical protein
MDAACSTEGAMINAYKILFGTPGARRSSQRPKHGWRNNIRRDLKEMR